MKYKIIRCIGCNGYQYDDYYQALMDTMDWRECSEDEIDEIQNACHMYNMRVRNESLIVITDQYNTDTGIKTLLTDYRQYITELKEKERIEEEKRQKDKERKAKLAYERKLKQLEKLKKELDQG